MPTLCELTATFRVVGGFVVKQINFGNAREQEYYTEGIDCGCLRSYLTWKRHSMTNHYIPVLVKCAAGTCRIYIYSLFVSHVA